MEAKTKNLLELDSCCGWMTKKGQDDKIILIINCCLAAAEWIIIGIKLIWSASTAAGHIPDWNTSFVFHPFFLVWSTLSSASKWAEKHWKKSIDPKTQKFDNYTYYTLHCTSATKVKEWRWSKVKVDLSS